MVWISSASVSSGSARGAADGIWAPEHRGGKHFRFGHDLSEPRHLPDGQLVLAQVTERTRPVMVDRALPMGPPRCIIELHAKTRV